jgi:branched-chain amino acid transport system permease protein
MIAALLAPLVSANAYLLNVLVLMLVFILFASAWNFLAFSGQASLGHAAFFGLGAYFSVLIAKGFGLPPLMTIFFGGIAAAIIGVLIGITCVRLREWFLAMVTFGFAVIIQTLVVSSFAPITGGWDGLPAPRLIPGASSLLFEYYTILAITAICILVLFFVLRSRVGLAFAAIRENEMEARAAGVDPVKFKLFAFALSTFMAGVAGALEIHHFGYITPEIFGAEISFWPVIYSIFGGLGTIAGPILGTVLLTFVWDGLKDMGLTYERFILIGGLLILVVIFLPKGLISLPEKLQASFRKKGS